ncbi:MAG: VanZ family protein [Burkholderiaceae bacterium]
MLYGAAARRCWRLLLLALLLVISYLALTPLPPKALDTGWDKLNHFLAFASLAWTAFWSLAPRRLRWLWVLLALLAYGGAIELIQLHVPGRDGDWADLLADAIGISLGLLPTCLLHRALAGAPAPAR